MRTRRWNVASIFLAFAIFIFTVVGLGFPHTVKYVATSVKEQEMEEHLRVLAAELAHSFELRDTKGAGFYLANGDLMCGDKNVRLDDVLMDDLRALTDVHFAVFNGSKRVSTTITTKSGTRYVTTFEIEIWNQYGSQGETYFTTDEVINEKPFWGYYYPIQSKQGFPLGMVYAGVEASKMEASIEKTVKPFRILGNIFCAVAFVLLAVAAYFVLRSQRTVLKFMRMFDKGDFSEQVPKWLLESKSEYGEIGRHLVSMRDSLDGRVQKDTLTGLFNRRAAMYTLKKYFVEANTPGGETFCFAIGDIDFFKKVNDTYGHNCGDEVLKKVAQILSNNMQDFGFVARWGGEEFILVFKGKLPQAIRQLEYILASVRSAVVEYDDYEVKVTMTFGIVQYHAPNNLDYVISAADKLLYKGKESGRNQIVS
ncbi:MAG: diguanylate cyclase [Acetatifactor sp.]